MMGFGRAKAAVDKAVEELNQVRQENAAAFDDFIEACTGDSCPVPARAADPVPLRLSQERRAAR